MPTVRNIADHEVPDPNGAALLPGQTDDWDDADYAADMVAAGLVIDVDDDETADVPVAEPDDPGKGKTGDPTGDSSSGSSTPPKGGSTGSTGSSSGSSSSGSSGASSGSGTSGSSGSGSSSSSTATGGSQ